MKPARAKITRRSSDVLLQNHTLYIEDRNFNRNEVIHALRSLEYEAVIAPETGSECSTVAGQNLFRWAIIDNNLSDWIDRSNEISVKIGDRDCYSGIEVAEALLERDSNLQVGLFSSHATELQNALKRAPSLAGVELLRPKPGSPLGHITDFLEKAHKLHVKIKAVHNWDAVMPREVSVFLANKILTCLRQGTYFWRVGEYAWSAGINCEPLYMDLALDSSNNDISVSQEPNFILTIDKGHFEVESFTDPRSGDQIYLGDAFQNSLKNVSLNTLNTYLLTRAFSNELLRGKHDESQIVQALRSLGDHAMFESQRVLFKDISRNCAGGSKEDVYESLSRFHRDGFPKILDVFRSQVDEISDGVAYVKSESYSPERIVRKDTFAMEFLRDNHVAEDSAFEFTMYRPSLGGIGYHIQPI